MIVNKNKSSIEISNIKDESNNNSINADSCSSADGVNNSSQKFKLKKRSKKRTIMLQIV